MRANRIPVRSSLFASFVTLAAALVLGMAPAAQAMTNVVPNGDFELAPCGIHGDVVCDWNPLPGATIAWDATNPNMGLHSMQLTGPVTGGGSIEVTTIGNICLQIGPGVHSASFWYRTTDQA